MKDVYGPDYASDENIVQHEVAYGKDEMLLTEDRTSGTNAPRTIFEKRTNESWCVVLTSPPVASLAPASGKRVTLKPMRWRTSTQASPGYPEIQVIYVWSGEEKIYKPSQCYLKSSGRKEAINCTKAYK
ncbi:hypothetical protein [Caballeronia sp. BCC1704]|uniref:hypothetical protein n=1 Tax=Caballeronia sp. BCC1704 TaxID=2676300 RepID=UPI00158B5ADA|nr:hypothetical protein [Caballeronia sp. BCC1704]